MASIEIDGKPLEVENGKMIIEVADEAGIYIPRFCYHKKLSVAANCRMCLVEVENGRKTVPACATPITNGMKVFTKSKMAVQSQEAVMEFLLINHPLDCPICDQGGECELQDLSMGFGSDHSDYSETKRSVADDDLGPLIATEMTRCIHCTRCVRFGEEVAGVPELGAVGRGENMQISTYIQHSLTSEVSGNVIDLCPVGALTSKPFRFTARAWELSQHEGIAPHDCLGSNVYFHVRRNQLMRVVPRENESINETWLSDRDRFSYLGMNSKVRAQQPMIKRHGQWETASWQEALKFTHEGLSRIIKQQGPETIAAFAGPSSTLEEFYLLQKLMRASGINNVDHRLTQVDFQDQAGLPIFPENTLQYADLEHQATIVIMGCSIDREVPLAGLRARKAFLNGANIYAINPVDYPFCFSLQGKNIIAPQEIPATLAKLLLAIVGDPTTLPDATQRLLVGLTPDPMIQEIAEKLKQPDAVIVTGAIAQNHPHAALIRTLIHLISEHTGAKHLGLTFGANTAGAWIAGMIPHRTAFGEAVETPGLSAIEAIDARLKAYVLLNAEPGYDFVNPYAARQAIVALSAFNNESTQEYADVILPIAPYSETSGTFINVDGTWQTFKGALQPLAEARPAWKVLRVLGNVFGYAGFEYHNTEEIQTEIKRGLAQRSQNNYIPFYPGSLPAITEVLTRVGEWPLYRTDAIVRHAEALQQCASADHAVIKMHPDTAQRLGLADTAIVKQGELEITLPLLQDTRIACDVAWIPSGMPETSDLGWALAATSIKQI